jgi:hypothetical protein
VQEPFIQKCHLLLPNSCHDQFATYNSRKHWPGRLAVGIDRLRGRNVGMWLHRYTGRITCSSPREARVSRSLTLDNAWALTNTASRYTFSKQQEVLWRTYQTYFPSNLLIYGGTRRSYKLRVIQFCGSYFPLAQNSSTLNSPDISNSRTAAMFVIFNIKIYFRSVRS